MQGEREEWGRGVLPEVVAGVLARSGAGEELGRLEAKAPWIERRERGHELSGVRALDWSCPESGDRTEVAAHGKTGGGGFD